MPATPAEIETALGQLRLAKAALFVTSNAIQLAHQRGGKLALILPPLNAARDGARALVNQRKQEIKTLLEMP
jgi:hypothetical protein